MSYTIWYNDLSKENLRKLVIHCDKKIDTYFAKLDRKIKRIVNKKVREIMQRKKKK